MEAENLIFGIMYIAIGLMLMGISLPLKNSEVALNPFNGVSLKKVFTSERTGT